MATPGAPLPFPSLVSPVLSSTLESRYSFDSQPPDPPVSLPSRLFSMAFQPIVDLQTTRVVAYEALVRGLANEPAASILSGSRLSSRAKIDRDCRCTAIEVASAVGLLESGADLSININARAASDDLASLAATAAAADCAGIPLSRLIFEITEQERLRNPVQLEESVRHLRERGLRIAIDDFGAGFAGLSLLTEFRPDILKVDIALTRDIHKRPASCAIVRAILQICVDLDIQLIAEGVEEAHQATVLEDLGVRYMQGNYFAEPAFEALPIWPAA